MIFIISHSGHTVNKVMDWLSYYGEPYIRFSDMDNFFSLLHIRISNQEVSIRVKNDNFDVDLMDLKVGWIWHGNVRFKGLSMPEVNSISSHEEVSLNLRSQMTAVYGFIDTYINSRCVIGDTKRQNVNKLTVLHLARELGLVIPDTLITTKLSDIRKFGSDKQIITKSIQESPFIQDDKGHAVLRGYTVEVTEDALVKLDQENIFPSLVQEKLDKKYELRIFYLDGECFPMAIFSQRYKQTELDFRRYNNEVPNRMMKCSIPRSLEEKITELMKALDLNTGSLDFVKTKSGEYVFLEVNPVGQFGFVSDSCNYELEKVIAEKLISYTKK